MGDSIDFTENWGDKQRDLESFDLAEEDDHVGDGDSDHSVVDSDNDEKKPSKQSSSTLSAAAKAEKLEKRKRKFSEMKSKRLLAEQEAASSENTIENVVSRPLSSEAQADTLNTAFIEAKLDYEEKHFIAKQDLILSQNPFPQVISKAIPIFKKSVKSSCTLPKGSPMILVICPSAIRAAEVINMLSKQYHCIIAKLFAKHFKLQEQVEFLNTQSSYIAVGTPNRIAKLIEYGALRLDHMSLVLIDLYLDSKSFSILTLSDVRNDMIDLLSTWVSPLVAQEKVKLSLVPNFSSTSAAATAGSSAGSNKKRSHPPQIKQQNQNQQKDKYHHPKKVSKSS